MDADKIVKRKQNALERQVRKGTPFAVFPALMLAACGGGGGVRQTGNKDADSIPASGYVIDGYISDARVFVDYNNNGVHDPAESYVLTDRNGYFSGIAIEKGQILLVDNNQGKAIDNSLGFPLGFTMSAPAGYSVITPVTTLVSGLVQNGETVENAEKIVKSVLGITQVHDLASFDPIAGILNPNSADRTASEEYQVSSMRVANILALKDGNLSNTDDTNFLVFIKDFAKVLTQKHSEGETINLSNPDDLKSILPTLTDDTLETLLDLNQNTSYYEILDAQLINLASNADGLIKINDDTSQYYVAVKINGTLQSGQLYSLTLSSGCLTIIYWFSQEAVRCAITMLKVFRHTTSTWITIGTSNGRLVIRII